VLSLAIHSMDKLCDAGKCYLQVVSTSSDERSRTVCRSPSQRLPKKTSPLKSEAVASYACGTSRSNAEEYWVGLVLSSLTCNRMLELMARPLSECLPKLGAGPGLAQAQPITLAQHRLRLARARHALKFLQRFSLGRIISTERMCTPTIE
jgi:hypothetical protein